MVFDVVFSPSVAWIFFSDGVISFISLNVFLMWLSYSFRWFSLEQLICALRIKVFKFPHFQLLGTKEPIHIQIGICPFPIHCSFNLS